MWIRFTILSLSICIFNANVFAQSSPKPVKQTEYKDYFFVDRYLYDIKDFKRIDCDFAHGEAIPFRGYDTIAINNRKRGQLEFYDKKGRMFNSVKVSHFDALTSDYKKKIFIKENDLWVVDINPISGAFNEKRLTQLGTFHNTNLSEATLYKYKYFFRDKYVLANNKVNWYSLDLESSKLEIYENLEGHVSLSPNNEILIQQQNGKGIYSTNLETNTRTEIYPKEHNISLTPLWIDNHRAFVFQQAPNPNKNRSAMYGGFYFDFKTLKTGKYID